MFVYYTCRTINNQDNTTMKHILSLILVIVFSMTTHAQVSVQHNQFDTTLSLFAHTQNPRAMFLMGEINPTDHTIVYSVGLLANDNLGGVHTKLFVGPNVSWQGSNAQYGVTLGMYVGKKPFYIGYRNTFLDAHNKTGSFSVLIDLF